MVKYEMAGVKDSSALFLRFILVGCLNTLLGYSVFSFFIFLGFHYASAAFLSTCIGIIFNFKTVGRLVFRSNVGVRKFPLFLMSYTITYGVSVFLLWLLKSFSNNFYLTGFIVQFPAAILSFSLNKKFVFKHKGVAA